MFGTRVIPLSWPDELSSCTTFNICFWPPTAPFGIGYIGLIFLWERVCLLSRFRLRLLLWPRSSSEWSVPRFGWAGLPGIRVFGLLLWEPLLNEASLSPAYDGSLCIPPSLSPPISITDGLYLTCLIADPSFLGSWSGSSDFSPSMLFTSLGFSDYVFFPPRSDILLRGPP